MRQMKTNDPGSIVVMLLTLILFVGAVFTKGFTHDLLLEAGVFLVSVKLIIMAYKNSVSTKVLLEELLEIKGILLNRKPDSSPDLTEDNHKEGTREKSS